eukprot:CAMPEP_0197032598 /NCGR_PEP_ID=MMETSP1384-20130603/11239_1 /TAXON_ID=29189 /ORGANISM="Ammonia sp." /LENGTH=155 /DNA_ID=CAMNT_0042462283 /DNA_START=94 /DNA_END=558 /DNA_ORIENTATION=+
MAECLKQPVCIAGFGGGVLCIVCTCCIILVLIETRRRKSKRSSASKKSSKSRSSKFAISGGTSIQLPVKQDSVDNDGSRIGRQHTESVLSQIARDADNNTNHVAEHYKVDTTQILQEADEALTIAHHDEEPGAHDPQFMPTLGSLVIGKENTLHV